MSTDKIKPVGWGTIRRMSGPDRVFYCGLVHGLTPLAAYQNSDESRADATEEQYRDAVCRLLRRWESVFGPYLNKGARHESLAALAEAKIEQQLRSSDPKERDRGIIHTRAVAGMDAPTKSEHMIESPHLDKRTLVPLIPARERFGGSN